MANNQLTATPAGGTQTATGSPQANVGGGGFAAGQQSSNVQPGTPRDALNSQTGIPLNNAQLSTVSLSTAPTASTAAPAKTTHHTNPVLVGFSLILFLVAIVLFWSASRPVKNTSE